MATDSNQRGSPTCRLVLASASPRRAVLMEEAGFEVEIIPPPMDEPVLDATIMAPSRIAEALAEYKARSVTALIDDAWVLAGDTVVAHEGRIFGKPADRDDARKILSALGGTSHQVITGVALLDADSPRRLVRHDVTTVAMRSLLEAELEAYLDTGAWAGKAGAYGIQDRGDAFIERIDGSFTNVVGFPMELVQQMLTEWGRTPR